MSTKLMVKPTEPPQAQLTDRVRIAHGGGGEMTARLIEDHFLGKLGNPRLSPLTDSAIIPWPACECVFTTDSYVVTPLEFPGGDIGRLAVCGTVNDLAVMGARPIALSLGLILEEGLPFELLDRVIDSIARTARQAGVEIATGDTKVIERRGETPGLFINTAGVGRLIDGVRLDMAAIQPGDAVLINGTLADHGLTIMSQRAGIEFESTLRSDAAPLNRLIESLLCERIAVRFIRDATRGGAAGVLTDIAIHRGLSIEIDERSIPIRPTALHAAEMLGLDPLQVANEGKIICVVASDDAARAVQILRKNEYGLDAAIVGRITNSRPPLVELITRAGGRRIVQRPYGEELPRIC